MSSSDLDPALLAAIQEAVAAGMGLAPLAAPAPRAGEVMPTTPKLGLRQPTLDHLALVEDLNFNMGVLDNAITDEAVATLSNKTLTAPIINNPVINGWGNAQHNHIDPAGGGQLDGGAIISGDIGNGFLVRESYVQDYLGSGADIVDGVVRDTLWFGDPAGSETPLTALHRLAVGSLRLEAGSGKVAALAFQSSTAAGSGAGRIGQYDAPSTGLWLTANAWFDTATSKWSRDDVSKHAWSLNLGEATTALYHAKPGSNPITGGAQTWLPHLMVDVNGTLSLTPDAGAGNTLGVALSANMAIMLGQLQADMWNNNYRVLGFPNHAIFVNAASANTLEIGCNTYVDPGGQRRAMVGTIRACLLQLAAGDLSFWQMPQVADKGAHTPVQRLSMNVNGELTLLPATTSMSAITGYGNLIASGAEGQPDAIRLGSAYGLPGVYSNNRLYLQAENLVYLKSIAGNIQIQPVGGYCHPAVDNGYYLGHPGVRWANGYFVSLTTSTLNTTYLASGGNIQVAPAGGYLHPDGANSRYLGHPSLPWLTLYCSNLTATGQLSLTGGAGYPIVVEPQPNGTLYLRAGAAAAVYLNSTAAPNGLVLPEQDNYIVFGAIPSPRWRYICAADGSIHTCWEHEKEILGWIDNDEALEAVLATPLARYHSIDGKGVVHTDLTFAGPVHSSADPRLKIGTADGATTSAGHQVAYTMASVKALHAQITTLREEVTRLKEALAA